MIFWIDAQLSPALAPWLESTFDVSAFAIRDVGLRNATDREIFFKARRDGATVMTKDADFIGLVKSLGSPPQVVWIKCGNTSNTHLREILSSRLPEAIEFLRRGEMLVEIS